jgi:S1-C subfamily serine protease
MVWNVSPKSPADLAGIVVGDRLLAVDGADVHRFDQVIKLLRSDNPGKVSLRLRRKGRDYDVVLDREKLSSILSREGKTILSNGLIVPADSTDAEITQLKDLASEEKKMLAHLFPFHFPLNPDLYHGAFALLVFTDPQEVAVTGVEPGPAQRAGIRQGDIILTANDEALIGKTGSELEAIFATSQPKPIRLKIKRGGSIRSIEYTTEQTSELLKQNNVRIIKGNILPSWLTDEDLPCFSE